MTLFTIFMVALLIATFYFGFIRNAQVFRFRTDLLDQISTRNQAAIQDLRTLPGLTSEEVHRIGDIAMDRYRTYETVGYDEMLLKFWKPLTVEAWYDDTTFVK